MHAKTRSEEFSSNAGSDDDSFRCTGLAVESVQFLELTANFILLLTARTYCPSPRMSTVMVTVSLTTHSVIRSPS